MRIIKWVVWVVVTMAFLVMASYWQGYAIGQYYKGHEDGLTRGQMEGIKLRFSNLR